MRAGASTCACFDFSASYRIFLLSELALHQSIDKTAEFVVSRAENGPGFEQTLRDKERTNPKFSFLFPGAPFNDYYQYKLHQLRSRPGSSAPPPAMTLSQESSLRINATLQILSGSEQAITDARGVLMEKEFTGHEVAVALLIRQHCQKPLDSQRRVFILYLISDILHIWSVPFPPFDG